MIDQNTPEGHVGRLSGPQKMTDPTAKKTARAKLAMRYNIVTIHSDKPLRLSLKKIRT